MVRVSRSEWLALGAAALALAVGARALQWGIDKGDPRRTILRHIRAEADPRHDVVVVSDEAPELVAAVSPVPAVWGAPPLRDLTGFRRLYVVANAEGPLGPYEARLGRPTSIVGANALRWDLDGLRNVHFDITNELLDHVTARREGGRFEGPCPRLGTVMHCNSTDDWNHPRVDDHAIGSTPVHCLFAHPQEQSRLIFEANIPSARWLVGIVGMDDHAFFVGGYPVENHITFTPSDGGPAVQTEVVAPSRLGPTPYRIALGGHPGHLKFSITTANAGARQYCFTAVATD